MAGLVRFVLYHLSYPFPFQAWRKSITIQIVLAADSPHSLHIQNCVFRDIKTFEIWITNTDPRLCSVVCENFGKLKILYFLLTAFPHCVADENPIFRLSLRGRLLCAHIYQ